MGLALFSIWRDSRIMARATWKQLGLFLPLEWWGVTFLIKEKPLDQCVDGFVGKTRFVLESRASKLPVPVFYPRSERALSSLS